jgi:hypothetical protein
MSTSLHHLATDEDPTLVLAELRRAEMALSSELVSLRRAIGQVEAVLRCPPTGGSLLTVVEAARELRVSRARIFQLLAAGTWKECASVGLGAYRVGRSRPT